MPLPPTVIIKFLFSWIIFVLDFEFENYVRSVVPGCHGVRETTGNSGYGKAKKPSVSTTQVKDTSQDIFKKKVILWIILIWKLTPDLRRPQRKA